MIAKMAIMPPNNPGLSLRYSSFILLLVSSIPLFLEIGDGYFALYDQKTFFCQFLVQCTQDQICFPIAYPLTHRFHHILCCFQSA